MTVLQTASDSRLTNGRRKELRFLLVYVRFNKFIFFAPSLRQPDGGNSRAYSYLIINIRFVNCLTHCINDADILQLV